MKQPLQLSYDPDIDVLSIEGVHYSGEVFRRLSLPLDRWVRLYRRDYDRVVCIQELDAGTVTPEGFVESEAPKGRVELP